MNDLIYRYVDDAIDNLRNGYQGMAKGDIYMIEKILNSSEEIKDDKKHLYENIINETYKLIYQNDFRKAIYKIDEIKRVQVIKVIFITLV